MRYSDLKRRLYPDGKPNAIARALNRFWAWVHAAGIAPNLLVTLEVPGRTSGRVISLPLVMAVVDGEQYLVSMLGPNATWVRNVAANGGRATLRRGKREAISLVEVPVADRPPILKRYLQKAPGARPHFPVTKDDPLAAFVPIAPEYPVFRIQHS